MSDRNVVILTGRLTKEPELRTTPTGKQVCSFGIAVNRKRRKGEEETVADFPNCVVWDHQAEYLCQYATKGSLLDILGRLQTRSYDDADGKRVYVTEVLVNDVTVLRSPENGSKYDSGRHLGVSIRTKDIADSITEIEPPEEPASDDLPF